MSPRFHLSIILTSLIACACGETTMIKTYPPGARVTINRKMIGISPVEYSVSRDQIPSGGVFHYRLERVGYEDTEGQFTTTICGGRITGAVFSLGISLIFKRPVCLEDVYEFEMQPVLASRVEPDRGDTATRLREAEKLYDRGVITEQEYRRLRNEILQGL